MAKNYTVRDIYCLFPDVHAWFHGQIILKKTLRNPLKKAVQPTCRSDTLTFFNEVCIRSTVHRTNSSLKNRRTKVTLGGCYTNEISLQLQRSKRLKIKTEKSINPLRNPV